MLTKTDRAKLANLARSEGFTTLSNLASEMKTQLLNQRPGGATEFEFLRDVIEREGKILGVDAFLKEIENSV